MNQKLSEYHSGYRAFSREILELIDSNSNSDDFVFDNQILAQVIYRGYNIAEISCPTIYFKEASSKCFAYQVMLETDWEQYQVFIDYNIDGVSSVGYNLYVEGGACEIIVKNYDDYQIDSLWHENDPNVYEESGVFTGSISWVRLLTCTVEYGYARVTAWW